jgi:hypothetical protein
MEIKEFKKLAIDLDEFTANEVDNLEFMNAEELDDYQIEIERDTGNTSNWDDIRAILTFRHKINELNEEIEELKNSIDFKDRFDGMTINC